MPEAIDLTVIVPAYNEAAGLARVLAPLAEACAERGWRVMVVDDGSQDDTARVVRELAPRVVLVHNEVNQGYGAALKRGVRLAKSEWVATFDADGQHQVADLVRLAGETTGVDAVVGARGRDSHVSLTRAPGKWLLGLVANFLVGERLPDINCGLRIFRREALLSILQLASDRFSFSTSTLVALIKMGYAVHFAPVTTGPRLGRSTVRQVRDGLATTLLILRLITLFEPLRIMLPLGGGLMALGALYQIVCFFIYGLDLINTAFFLGLGGLIILAMGLIADQVSALRRELTLVRHDPGRDRD